MKADASSSRAGDNAATASGEVPPSNEERLPEFKDQVRSTAAGAVAATDKSSNDLQVQPPVSASSGLPDFKDQARTVAEDEQQQQVSNPRTKQARPAAASGGDPDPAVPMVPVQAVPVFSDIRFGADDQHSPDGGACSNQQPKMVTTDNHNDNRRHWIWAGALVLVVVAVAVVIAVTVSLNNTNGGSESTIDNASLAADDPPTNPAPSGSTATTTLKPSALSTANPTTTAASAPTVTPTAQAAAPDDGDSPAPSPPVAPPTSTPDCDTEIGIAFDCIGTVSSSCLSCVDDSIEDLFTNSETVSCDIFDSRVCTAIHDTCGCGSCASEVEAAYDCLYSDTGCEGIDCGGQTNSKLQPSDLSDGDHFGTSVSLDGDYMAIGARGHGEHGAVYLFCRCDGGIDFTQTEKIVPTEATGFQRYGGNKGVSIAGDYLAVKFVNAGTVDIYVRSGDNWIKQNSLTELGGFINSLALSNDTLVVGNSLANSAYVYTRSRTTWAEQAILVDESATEGADFGAEFGETVAIDGDTIVVGAPYDDALGSASVFVRSSDGTNIMWTQQAKLVADDGAANDQFGVGVAVSGSVAVVGSPNEKDSDFAGAAYVFELVPNTSGPADKTWSLVSKLVAEDGTAGNVFGYSVAVEGPSTVLVGAPGDNAAYLFTRPSSNGAAWTQQAKLLPEDNAFGFGFAVDLSGDTALVSSYEANSAYVFKLN